MSRKYLHNFIVSCKVLSVSLLANKTKIVYMNLNLTKLKTLQRLEQKCGVSSSLTILCERIDCYVMLRHKFILFLFFVLLLFFVCGIKIQKLRHFRPTSLRSLNISFTSRFKCNFAIRGLYVVFFWFTAFGNNIIAQF